ncbi:MAG: 3'(2'),5'-bisphosphate nucleotidase CysQ, partial [Thermomonas sp.]
MDEALREGVIGIAQRAAAAILAVYEGEFAVQHKDDRSPLTAADLAAHRCIVEGLQALTPGIPVLSEESRAIDIAERRRWRRLWVVDPLDGTREFVKRNGEFTINIALVEDGVAVFGLIQQPVTGALWHGAPGRGAFRREDAADRPIHARIPAAAPLRIAASRSHRDARTQALLDALPGSEVVGCGSALKFCRIAEGAIDLYPRFGPTSEWDTAAGQAIVEAAGG